jgi:4-phospho-D-threonate 3-dehydrogenase / 4-phospho-D-erythronate 3-dehydrogenase
MKKDRNSPIILIPTGDPAGVGPEIAMKALLRLCESSQCPIIPLGDQEILGQAAAMATLKHPLHAVDSLEELASCPSGSLPFYRVTLSKGITIQKGAITKEAGEHAMAIIRKAVELCMADNDRVMVTAPINKRSLSLAGWSKGGHTEFLMELTGAGSVETVFCLESLLVFFLTRHLSLKEAIRCIHKETLLKAIIRMDGHLKSLGIGAPRIAIPGLNPHSGEEGLFGSEEERELKPAIFEAREKGIDVKGPIGADSIFHLGLQGHFDAILSLYHDQGHIALKTRDFFGTVTMTLGLPFLRTSVDHGTGLDIAWKGIASEESLVSAVKLGENYYRVNAGKDSEKNHLLRAAQTQD